MKRNRHPISIGPLLMALFLIAGPAWSLPTYTFSYQGFLKDEGRPAEGFYDLRFRLYDDADPGIGAQQGEDNVVCNMPVEQGLFTADLDFGNAFDGRELFLEVAVAPAGACGPSTVWTTLEPLLPIRPAPYAQFALDGTATNGCTWIPDPDTDDLVYLDGNVGVGVEMPEASVSVRPYLRVRLSGLVTVGSNSDFVTGSGTAFLSELEPGKAILIDGTVSVVEEIFSNTELRLVEPRPGALDAEIFIGADTLHLVDGAGRVRIRVDEDGDLFASDRVGAARFCDAAGSGCQTATSRWARPCPPGFSAVNNDYCIQTNDSATGVNWIDAVRACAFIGAHLCTPAEWLGACDLAGSLGPPLVDMEDGNEWVDNVLIADSTVGLINGVASSCGASTWDFPGDANRYRCCASR